MALYDECKDILMMNPQNYLNVFVHLQIAILSVHFSVYIKAHTCMYIF